MGEIVDSDGRELLRCGHRCRFAEQAVFAERCAHSLPRLLEGGQDAGAMIGS
ncbi:hypothetical protein ACRS5S_29670 [Nocardia asiatica]|uniref:hypothetical protein n=1 Tax=Nocardia asiatica TaxID=209252 RepID=UPI0024550A64|nr:hypothetical protein [Nocardia asiatica]